MSFCYRYIKAYVVSGAGDDDVRKWLKEVVGVSLVPLLDANLVVFTGGADVSPGLYGEENVASNCSWLRDQAEMSLFQYCQDRGIPMFGICRGSQFLHVMMKGKLWQDVTDHCCQHDLIDLDTGLRVEDTCSTHHQMVRMDWTDYASAAEAGFELVATPHFDRSEHYVDDKGVTSAAEADVANDGTFFEVEAYRYSKEGTSIMGIQGHPEWGGESFAAWAADKLVGWHAGLVVAEDVAA